MVRTVVSIEEEDQAWLDRRAAEESVSRFILDSVVLIDHFNGIDQAMRTALHRASESCPSDAQGKNRYTSFRSRNLTKITTRSFSRKPSRKSPIRRR